MKRKKSLVIGAVRLLIRSPILLLMNKKVFQNKSPRFALYKNNSQFRCILELMHITNTQWHRASRNIKHVPSLQSQMREMSLKVVSPANLIHRSQDVLGWLRDGICISNDRLLSALGCPNLRREGNCKRTQPSRCTQSHWPTQLAILRYQFGRVVTCSYYIAIKC